MEEKNTIRFKRYPLLHEKINEMEKNMNLSQEEATTLYFEMLSAAIKIVENEKGV